MIPTQEPRMEWLDILFGGFIYLGFLLFLVALHLLTINSVGNVSSVLNVIFVAFVIIYSMAVIFGFVGIFVQILRWVAWQVITPPWKKEKMREFNG